MAGRKLKSCFLIKSILELIQKSNMNIKIILVKKDNKLGYAKLDGTFLVPPKYDILKAYSNGLARVQLDKKWGFMDTNGVEIIELIYDAAKPFTSGRSQVQLNGKTFYIDKTGKEINAPY